MNNNKIVVVGSINMDFVVRTPNHPQPGETVLGSYFRTFPGGKGANQAIAAARMGADVTMIGRVGRDPFRQTLLKNLQENGVHTEYTYCSDGLPTGVALITVNSTGENTIVVVPGANSNLTPDDVEKSEGAFRSASLLMLQLEIPIPVVIHSIRMAKKHNLKILLNPAPAQPLDPSLLSNIDYLIPNQTELAILSSAKQDEDIMSLVKKLQSKYKGVIVVTQGNHGALVFDNDVIGHLESHQVDVVDTTGAGDSFIGAFSAAICEGLPPLEAAKWGNAAAAISITREGAQSSLPIRREVETMMGKEIYK